MPRPAPLADEAAPAGPAGTSRPVRRSRWAALLCAGCLCLGTTGLTGRANLPVVDAAAAPDDPPAQTSALAAEEPE